jgi:photosystem II stability/assembly factor-like uncharacterized protein
MQRRTLVQAGALAWAAGLTPLRAAADSASSSAGARSAASAPAGGVVGHAWQRPAQSLAAPQRAVLMAGALAGERVVGVGERGIIIVSDDSARTWRQVACPVSVSLTMVRFADARHGVAVGQAGTVLTTHDSGNSWRVRLDGARAAAVIKEAATTPEAQREAERLLTDGPDKPFLDVIVWDARQLLVVGAYGLALHSTDGGESWTPWMARLPNPKSLHWYVARRAGDRLLLAGEQGLIARSDDRGQSFTAVTSPYKGSWFTGELEPDGQALLAGLRGNVWRGGIGAAPWRQLASPVSASVTASTRSADGSPLLASQAGVILRSVEGRLVPLAAPPIALPAGLLVLPDGQLLAFGATGVTKIAATAASAPARP